ncbi:hypothetical protein ATI02_3066 [Pseudomonas baetica]|uniref:Uncharacterized protein n=1 Tax=Pseudomonas baetica TaxID=674054 RepID=A0ABX4Q0A0_9PSED|nr:hypothetical protein ATI02_3066 [Pseudomonas baetica]
MPFKALHLQTQDSGQPEQCAGLLISLQFPLDGAFCAGRQLVPGDDHKQAGTASLSLNLHLQIDSMQIGQRLPEYAENLPLSNDRAAQLDRSLDSSFQFEHGERAATSAIRPLPQDPPPRSPIR